MIGIIIGELIISSLVLFVWMGEGYHQAKPLEHVGWMVWDLACIGILFAITKQAAADLSWQHGVLLAEYAFGFVYNGYYIGQGGKLTDFREDPPGALAFGGLFVLAFLAFNIWLAMAGMP